LESPRRDADEPLEVTAGLALVREAGAAVEPGAGLEANERGAGTAGKVSAVAGCSEIDAFSAPGELSQGASPDELRFASRNSHHRDPVATAAFWEIGLTICCGD
jgi:hypothetical protein